MRPVRIDLEEMGLCWWHRGTNTSLMDYAANATLHLHRRVLDSFALSHPFYLQIWLHFLESVLNSAMYAQYSQRNLPMPSLYLR